MPMSMSIAMTQSAAVKRRTVRRGTRLQLLHRNYCLAYVRIQSPSQNSEQLRNPLRVAWSLTLEKERRRTACGGDDDDDVVVVVVTVKCA